MTYVGRSLVHITLLLLACLHCGGSIIITFFLSLFAKSFKKSPREWNQEGNVANYKKVTLSQYQQHHHSHTSCNTALPYHRHPHAITNNISKNCFNSLQRKNGKKTIYKNTSYNATIIFIIITYHLLTFHSTQKTRMHKKDVYEYAWQNVVWTSYFSAFLSRSKLQNPFYNNLFSYFYVIIKSKLHYMYHTKLLYRIPSPPSFQSSNSLNIFL